MVLAVIAAALIVVGLYCILRACCCPDDDCGTCCADCGGGCDAADAAVVGTATAVVVAAVAMDAAEKNKQAEATATQYIQRSGEAAQRYNQQFLPGPQRVTNVWIENDCEGGGDGGGRE